MSATTYDNVLRSARQLEPDQQLRLVEELAASLRHDISTQTRRSILEIQGLGKDIWQGIDAQEYVNRERDSWGG